jgi:2-methylisocitrate lyase-like PEP mutase family enzyme
MTVSKGGLLRKHLKAGFLCIPGIYDCLSAILAQTAGFDAVYVSGSAASVSILGSPDIGLMTASELVAHVARLSAAVDIPLVVDADTGFGNELNTWRTVRDLEAAGAAAIQLEDQTFPKRCGHLGGKTVIPATEYCRKLDAALQARRFEDTVIVARTDARGVNGLDDALHRARMYAQVGADIIFLEAPRTEQEIERIPELVHAPLMFNIVQGGVTPRVTLQRLADLRYACAIVPGVSIKAAASAVQVAMSDLAGGDLDSALGAGDLSPAELFRLVGLDKWVNRGLSFAND